jgi:hypothetical protein
MTKWTGQSDNPIKLGWPHQVSIIVPGMGSGGRLLHEMATFCRNSGLNYRTQSNVRFGDLARMLWCFVSPEDAAAFRERFADHVDIVVALEPNRTD